MLAAIMRANLPMDLQDSSHLQPDEIHQHSHYPYHMIQDYWAECRLQLSNELLLPIQLKLVAQPANDFSFSIQLTVT